jgi:hypothetical protein
MTVVMKHVKFVTSFKGLLAVFYLFFFLNSGDETCKCCHDYCSEN